MGKAAEAKAVGALEVKNHALVLGTLTAGEVNLKDADVLGTLTADKLAATGTVCVGSDEEDVAGKLVVNELVSGTVFADSEGRPYSQPQRRLSGCHWQYRCQLDRGCRPGFSRCSRHDGS